jgi:hypothetical protein
LEGGKVEVEDYSDLERALKKAGYSERVVSRIIKWYANHSSGDLTLIS